MLKHISKYLSFWIILNLPLCSQVRDTIEVFENCGFCNFPDNDERVIARAVLSVDSLAFENESLFTIPPQPSRSYESILSSINFSKTFLFAPVYGGRLLLKMSIDTTGTADIIKSDAYGFESTIHEDSVINAFSREKFIPAKRDNTYVRSVLCIYLSSELVLEKYINDENVFERKIDILRESDIKITANKKFVVDTQNPEDKWRKLAKSDIEKGNCYLLSFGYKAPTADYLKSNMITKKYGFEFKDMGCEYPYGGEAYNEEVMKYLTVKNGEGWYERFLSELRNINK